MRRTASATGKAGSMPAGGMTVADGCGGLEVMKGSDECNIQQIHKPLKSRAGADFQHTP